MIRQRLVDLDLLAKQEVSTESVGCLLRTQTGTIVSYIVPNSPTPLVNAALEGKEVHFVTGGKWSLHQLLEAALAVTGPAVLHLSTFSITEFSARLLAGHLDAGRLRELHMLIDYRAKVRYPEVYQLAANVATSIRLTPVHAKVMVIEGEHCTLSLQGSANWTDNPRIESGVLTRDQHVADFYKDWLKKSMADGHPFN